eukprot:287084_1
MGGLFAKLNKQRAKMSITEDGEEMYEPTDEARQSIRSAAAMENDGDMLDAAMVKPGSGVSVVDKYQMVDELKNVLKNRRKAAIQRFKTGNTTIKEEKDHDEEDESADRMQSVNNIRNAYPREQVIENDYSDSSEDYGDAVSEAQEKQFLMELNRLGLSSALMTTRNTEIQSFGYDAKRDENTMSLFAVLQAQNKAQIDRVLKGKEEDIEME